jgi:magnesium chelatase subunit D
MKQYLYPFSAIVEQNTLKTALLLNAVDPSIGGVLIRGHKGTGKSTAARALAQLLPYIEVLENCPFNSDPRNPFDPGSEFTGSRQKAGQPVLRPMQFVELPLNATEDRLVGSLHIEKALKTGERRFEPGLLAAANRGILYVDEVNLLADHLVDMLLDAAASGFNVVEREGISFVHPARFILIGTMNPEEGELRPQLLDRFGLCVAVESVLDPASRKEILNRHLELEKNPGDFFNRWAPVDQTVSDQIVYAREHLGDVGASDKLMTAIINLTRELKLQGHRADIAIFKAARAHAALMEKKEMDLSDVLVAAPLAIRHRTKSPPLDRPEILEEKIRTLTNRALGQEPDAKKGGREQEEISLEDMAERLQVPGSAAAGSVLFSFLGAKYAEAVLEPDRSVAAEGIDVEKLLPTEKQRKRKLGKTVIGPAGRYLRAERIKPGERDYSIAVDATLRQAAARSARSGVEPEGNRPISKDDFRKKQLAKPVKKLIVFVVDSSGSMASGERVPMKAAKGAVLAILRKAHQSRSEVAMTAFGGRSATLVLSPTSSVSVAESALERLPAGGGTPFADSLLQAWQLIRSERLKNPGIRPILVIISDGEANIPISAGADPLEELESLAQRIARDRIPSLFIDAAARRKGGSEMQRIADRMQASYINIKDLSASSLLDAINRGKIKAS